MLQCVFESPELIQVTQVQLITVNTQAHDPIEGAVKYGEFTFGVSADKKVYRLGKL